MDLATITMDRVEARKHYLEYRDEIRSAQERELDEVRARQLEQDRAIAAGYRQLSLGRQLIRLSETITAGGTRDNHFPKLAVMRADIETVEMTHWLSGEVRYQPYEPRWNGAIHRSPTKVMRFDAFPRREEGATLGGIATVPNIPPAFRPDGNLSRYHILWEVDQWAPVPSSTRRSGASRTGDPALLRHLRGDLWAVLAVWDLTPVEKAALEMSAVLR